MKLQEMKNKVEISNSINIRLDTIKQRIGEVEGELQKLHKRQWK